MTTGAPPTPAAVCAGDTFVIDPTGGSNQHLWIVLAVDEPSYAFETMAIIVNFTTWTNRADPACDVDKGDHPFLAHKSYVFYGGIRELEVSVLQKLGTKNAACDEALQKRIAAGAHRSQFTKRGFKGRIPQ